MARVTPPHERGAGVRARMVCWFNALTGLAQDARS
jgi:hypothetical protein